MASHTSLELPFGARLRSPCRAERVRSKTDRVDVLEEWRAYRGGHGPAQAGLLRRYLPVGRYWLGLVRQVLHLDAAASPELAERADQIVADFVLEVRRWRAGVFDRDFSDAWFRAQLRKRVVRSLLRVLPRPKLEGIVAAHDDRLGGTTVGAVTVATVAEALALTRSEVDGACALAGLLVIAADDEMPGKHRRWGTMLGTGDPMRAMSSHAERCQFCGRAHRFLAGEPGPTLIAGDEALVQHLLRIDQKFLRERTREPADVRSILDRRGATWTADEQEVARRLLLVDERVNQADSLLRNSKLGSWSEWVSTTFANLVVEYDPDDGRRFWRYVMIRWISAHRDELIPAFRARFYWVRRDEGALSALASAFVMTELDKFIDWYDLEKDRDHGRGFFGRLKGYLWHGMRGGDFYQRALFGGMAAQLPSDAQPDPSDDPPSVAAMAELPQFPAARARLRADDQKLCDWEVELSGGSDEEINSQICLRLGLNPENLKHRTRVRVRRFRMRKRLAEYIRQEVLSGGEDDE